MKKLTFVLLLFLGIVSVIKSQEYQINEQIIYTDENSSARIQHVKSAVDSKDNLYIVFVGYDNHVYFGTNRSGEWKYQHLKYYDSKDEETKDASTFPNIAIDANDNITIVMFGTYKENIYWQTKHVSDCEGEWSFKDGNIDSDMKKFYLFDEYSDMCVDKNGGLHLYACATVYEEDGSNHWMSATYWYKSANSDVWEMEMIIPGIVNEFSYGADPSIATAGDMVYITIGGDRDLHFASKKISGGEWDIEAFEKFSQPGEMNAWKHQISITTNPAGNPVFVFYDYFDWVEEGLNWFYGINVLDKSGCGNGEWMIDNPFDEAASKGAPAIAINSQGKYFVAFGRSNPTIYTRSCGCDQSWTKIYDGPGDHKNDFVDMIIDSKDKIHLFHVSNYDNNLYYITVTDNSEFKNCNYPPYISGYTGKTNIAPGESWRGSISALDSECDKISFYTIIKPDYVKIEDIGNGTADISMTVPEGEGFGDVIFSVFCLDESHPETNDEVSVITFKLKLTQEGEEEGSVLVENKCIGSGSSFPISQIGNILVQDRDRPYSGINSNYADNNSGSGTQTNNSDGNIIDENSPSANSDCEEFLLRYEDFADKYAPIAKRVQTNPMDMDAINQLTELMEQFGKYSEEWEELYDCHDIPGFTERYEAASKKIEEANN